MERLNQSICDTLDSLLPAARNYILEEKASGRNHDELAKNVVKLALLTDRAVDKDIIDLKSAMEIDFVPFASFPVGAGIEYEVKGSDPSTQVSSKTE